MISGTRTRKCPGNFEKLVEKNIQVTHVRLDGE